MSAAACNGSVTPTDGNSDAVAENTVNDGASDATDTIAPTDTMDRVTPPDATDTGTTTDATDTAAPMDTVDVANDTPATDVPRDVPADLALDVAPDVAPDVVPDGGPVDGGAPAKLDVLFVVQNSNQMLGNSGAFLSGFAAMIDRLVHPLCTNASDPTPHPCTSSTDVPQYPPVTSLQIGVVDTDLGTPGSSVPGCANSALGDDALLNPIRYGAAETLHEPWTQTSLVSTYPRPTDCTSPTEFPAFLSYSSTPIDTTTALHDFECNAGLLGNGCGLGAQLEAAWRALIWHDATDASGNTSPNADFVRSDAVLAIVLVTDHEDGSVENCTYANGSSCTDGTSVYDASSMSWASMNLSLRFVMDTPGSANDPNWPLDRYVDPTNASSGLLSLKPGHPERVIFGALAGVPLGVGTVGGPGTLEAQWDSLLGTPSSAGPDDFYGRNAGPGSVAYNQMSAEGPVSMYQANPDPNCVYRVLPACRQQGTTYSTSACTGDVQYYASPARRIAEVARRLDQDPLCGGTACHNGFISSLCATDLSAAYTTIATRIEQRIAGM